MMDVGLDMEQYLLSKIPKINTFLKLIDQEEILVLEDTTDNTAYIVEDVNCQDQTCSFNGKTACFFDEKKVFKIVNQHRIGLLPIDGNKGLLGGTSNCDFIFFNEIDFCFVELKLNAISNEQRAVRKNRKKAIKQIGKTVSYFDKKLDGNYLELKIKAFVATPDIYPRANSEWKSMATEFLEENKIRIFEQRYYHKDELAAI